ncbi:hypothetical protein ATANTOWER_001732 [Ataeniobius toweri]|uniref:Secreted protein n=1 Tax=Ataeniobius toweri TaxID=208326 RepID=A0ABU7AEF4_9TELE|nr:hypothetical protein [Ataeniobius toweri]
MVTRLLLLIVVSRFAVAGVVAEGSLVKWFASVTLLVQAALTALHHVDEVGERLLLVYRNIPEVATHSLRRSREQIRNKSGYLGCRSQVNPQLDLESVFN